MLLGSVVRVEQQPVMNKPNEVEIFIYNYY
jgi:hypothetical protein